MPAPPLRIFNSPCKSVCRLDEQLGWCIGCHRTPAEIKAWPTASDEWKRQVISQLEQRSGQRAAAAGKPNLS